MIIYLFSHLKLIWAEEKYQNIDKYTKHVSSLECLNVFIKYDNNLYFIKQKSYKQMNIWFKTFKQGIWADMQVVAWCYDKKYK